jgi:hypothetical protein
MPSVPPETNPTWVFSDRSLPSPFTFGFGFARNFSRQLEIAFCALI